MPTYKEKLEIREQRLATQYNHIKILLEFYCDGEQTLEECRVDLGKKIGEVRKSLAFINDGAEPNLT